MIRKKNVEITAGAGKSQKLWGRVEKGESLRKWGNGRNTRRGGPATYRNLGKPRRGRTEKKLKLRRKTKRD